MGNEQNCVILQDTSGCENFFHFEAGVKSVFSESVQFRSKHKVGGKKKFCLRVVQNQNFNVWYVSESTLGRRN